MAGWDDAGYDDIGGGYSGYDPFSEIYYPAVYDTGTTFTTDVWALPANDGIAAYNWLDTWHGGEYTGPDYSNVIDPPDLGNWPGGPPDVSSWGGLADLGITLPGVTAGKPPAAKPGSGSKPAGGSSGGGGSKPQQQQQRPPVTPTAKSQMWILVLIGLALLVKKAK